LFYFLFGTMATSVFSANQSGLRNINIIFIVQMPASATPRVHPSKRLFKLRGNGIYFEPPLLSASSTLNHCYFYPGPPSRWVQLGAARFLAYLPSRRGAHGGSSAPCSLKKAGSRNFGALSWVGLNPPFCHKEHE
jgi:hypothetical protein